MPVKLLRQILALLIMTAYVGVTVFQVAPVYAANVDVSSSSSMNGMMHGQAGQSDKIPCKGMLPNCVTDLGCIFLLSLPSAPELNVFTRTAWLSVVYPDSSQFLHGRTIEPALGPPIPLA
jgi:hypothetical protein